MKKLSKLLFLLIFSCIHINFARAEKEIESLKSRLDIIENNIFNGIIFDGRIHANIVAFDNKYNSELDNKADIRRARLGVKKEIDNFMFHLEGAFKDDNLRLYEAYISYILSKDTTLTFGQIKTNNFIENCKSSNTMANTEYVAFMREDWFTSILIGLNFDMYKDNWGLSTGIFGENAKMETRMTNDSRFSYLFRGFISPLNSDNQILHLGVDFIYANFKRDPPVNPDNFDYNYIYGFEFAYQYKVLNLTAEFLRTYNNYLDSSSGAYNGWYIEFIANLTGEYNQYEHDGTFGNIDVKHKFSKGGAGAFQFTTRYSVADGNSNKKYIGYRSDYTFGLNWIPENNMRFMLNYSINKLIDRDRIRKDYDQFMLEVRMFF